MLDNREVIEQEVTNWEDRMRRSNCNFDTLVNLIKQIERSVIYKNLEGRGSKAKATKLFHKWERSTTNIHPDLKVPLDTIIKAGDDREYTFKINPKNSNLIDLIIVSNKQWCGTYTPNQINNYILKRNWQIQGNISNEIKNWLNTFTNVTKSSEFRATASSKFVSTNLNSSTSFCIHPGITGNCQLTVLEKAGTMIQHSSDLSLQFKEIARRGSRDVLLMDIRETNIPRLKSKINNDAIILENSYKSTNGSKMAIVLINARKL